jgi:carbon-monoxide dehydrogenase small subunit
LDKGLVQKSISVEGFNMATIRLTVNGTAHRLETEPERPLLEVLREDLGLTGTKYGCGEGQCRACTVLLNGKAIVSCITPVRSAEGGKITTIEGLSEGGKLHPVQQAFLDEGAMQCGYCVPGMVLRTVALLDANPKPTEDQVVEGLNGSLCRCSGYVRILAAVRRATEAVKKESEVAQHAK